MKKYYKTLAIMDFILAGCWTLCAVTTLLSPTISHFSYGVALVCFILRLISEGFKNLIRSKESNG